MPGLRDEIQKLIDQGRYLDALKLAVDALDGLIGTDVALAEWARAVAWAACLAGQDCNAVKKLLGKAGVKVEFLPPPLGRIGELPPDKALKVIEFVRKYSGDEVARYYAILYVAKRVAAGTPLSKLQDFINKTGIKDVVEKVNQHVAKILAQLLTGKPVETTDLVNLADKIDKLLEAGNISEALKLLPRLEKLVNDYITAAKIVGDEEAIKALRAVPAITLLNIAISAVFSALNGRITVEEEKRILATVKRYAERMGLSDVAKALDYFMRVRPDVTSLLKLLEELTGRRVQVRLKHVYMR